MANPPTVSAQVRQRLEDFSRTEERDLLFKIEQTIEQTPLRYLFEDCPLQHQTINELVLHVEVFAERIFDFAQSLTPAEPLAQVANETMSRVVLLLMNLQGNFEKFGLSPQPAQKFKALETRNSDLFLPRLAERLEAGLAARVNSARSSPPVEPAPKDSRDDANDSSAGESSELFEPPALAPEAQQRTNLVALIAAERLQTELLSCWSRYFPFDVRKVRPFEPQVFFQPFFDYGITIYDGYANEFLVTTVDYATYDNVLNNALKTKVCNWIAPYGGQGEWQRTLSGTWRLFDHPRHSELHPTALEVVNAFDGVAPRHWTPFIQSLHKAISRRTLHWLVEWNKFRAETNIPDKPLEARPVANPNRATPDLSRGESFQSKQEQSDQTLGPPWADNEKTKLSVPGDNRPNERTIVGSLPLSGVNELAVQIPDGETADRCDDLPTLPESARSLLQAAEVDAVEKLAEARRYLDQVVKADALIESLRFSLGQSGKLREIQDERRGFLQSARRSANIAVERLFDAYATAYWEFVGRDSDRFAEILPVIASVIDRILARPELAKQISSGIVRKTALWSERTIREDPKHIAQVAEASQEYRARYYDKPDPLYFFDKWPLPPVSEETISNIKTGLVKIHFDAVRGLDCSNGSGRVYVNWSIRAYDVFAQELFDAGSLTQELVERSIPEMVFDACMSAYWFRYYVGAPTQNTPNEIKFGSFWVLPDQLDWVFLLYLDPGISLWRLKLNNRNTRQRTLQESIAANPPHQTSAEERKNERSSVVMPILESKGWTRGKWATAAGVGKNCVYAYLDGTRNPTDENRRALAEELGLKLEELPE